MADGWISLHRKIRKNPVFNDHQLLRLWIICLTEATHKGREQLVGKQIVQLEAGQFITGRFDLHKMYSEGLKAKDRVTEYTVWRWLVTLQDLEFLSINSSNKFSIVTVVNWSKYQSHEQENEHQMSNKRATNEQQMSTNNNVNKDNKVNKVNKEINNAHEFAMFWEVYPKKVAKQAATKAWEKLMKEKVDPSILVTCAMNYGAYVAANETEVRFVLHPSSFLNGKRFEEYTAPFLIHSKGGQANEANKSILRPGESQSEGAAAQGPLTRAAIARLERDRDKLAQYADHSDLPF